VRVFTKATSAGAWVERAARLDSVLVSDTVNERSTANATLIDPSGALHFRRGDGIKIERANGALLFRGFIERAKESRLGTGGVREHTLECVDLHYLADKRVAAKSYTDTTCGGIVTDLLSEYLAAEGVTAGVIQDGPNVRAIAFNYVSVADAITDLAQRAGFWWRITHAGELDFASPTFAAGGGVTFNGETVTFGGEVVAFGDAIEPGEALSVNVSAVALADSVSVVRHASSYRNRQWVKGGRDRTVPQVETQFGDGERRAFAIGFPIAEEPTVEVSRAGGAFTGETAGAAGIQEGRDWSYTFGSSTIVQNPAGTVLASGDRVRVTYVGLFDVIARVDDVNLQNERALAEGGSGIVERVLSDRTSGTRDSAFQLAGELIEYFGRPATVARFTTSSLAFAPGAGVTVNLPEAGISGGDGLVTTVERFTVSGRERCVVTLVIGPMEGSWAQWFGHLSRRIDRAFDAAGGEVEVVTRLEEFSKTWTEAERPNIFYEKFPASDLHPGSSVVPAFEREHRVRFLSWYSGATEVGRKALTQQLSTSSPIVTVVVLTVNDAVGSFTHFGWWGGSTATSALGSGIEVDKQAFSFTKTDIEQIQVVKTDTVWV
jgi:hypothetical protein